MTMWLVFISGSEERVFGFSMFDCKSNFFEPQGLSTCTPVQVGRWCQLDLPRMQSLWSLQTIFLNSCSKVGGRRWAWLERNSGIPVCEVCGCWTCWACHRWNFGALDYEPYGLCSACHGSIFIRLMVFAGPACDSIFESKIARFVVSIGPATDKILRLHFVRLLVFAGPASDRIFVPECQVCGLYCACHGRNFGAPFCKAHGLCWACQPASDKIFVLQIVTFVV